MVKTPYTGIWIRNHLSKVGEDYIQHMSTLYRKEMRKNKNCVSSYHAFCKLFFILEHINLIEPLHMEESSKSWLKPRKYYRIVKGKENNIEWNNPQKYYKPKAT